MHQLIQRLGLPHFEKNKSSCRSDHVQSSYILEGLFCNSHQGKQGFSLEFKNLVTLTA
jgi:hypothetical protein